MSSPLLHTAAAFALALVATLVLAAWLTPRAWWRRANVRALAFLCAGTFGIGALLLWVLEPAPVAHAATLPAIAPEPLPAASDYRAYDDLNLRDGTGVSAKRVAVVPAGASVTATGERKGDWWQVSARVDGREVRGWVSSLWLRRPDEAR
jgi:uncharacterized protein YgiM (DUF1202 family)